MPTSGDAAPRGDASEEALAEQERLIEDQLRCAYDDVLRLRKERFETVYTATWLIVRPLLRAEEALRRLAGRLAG